MDSLVSIIVPVYNTDHNLLDKCIESIIGQTYKSLEIIVVDDGSNQATAKYCDSISKKDERIVVIHKSNGGLSSARNAGLDIAKGDYIAFVDSDDFIHKESIENLVECQRSSGCPVVCMQSIIFDENGKTLFHFGNESKSYSSISAIDYIKGICTKTKSESVCDKLFKREMLEERRFEFGRLNEDFFFLSKLLMEEMPDIALLDFAGYNYFKHSGTITSNRTNFTSLRDAISNSKELTYLAKEIRKDCIKYFAYSTLFQARVLFANLSLSDIRKKSSNWNFVKGIVNEFSSFIDCCDLSLSNRLILRGLLWCPLLTNRVYHLIR